jgi:hypothetical protein
MDMSEIFITLENIVLELLEFMELKGVSILEVLCFGEVHKWPLKSNNMFLVNIINIENLIILRNKTEN